MAVNDGICKDKGTSLLILETIMESIKSDTQKAALKAVFSWIQDKYIDDVTRLTHEEREARIWELLTEERNRMTEEERKERAAFYLEVK
ncbi:MAG: hypothetical protein LBH43_10985 [Treponema sp.]|jgi:hypothetical protein|nr:hypothetical protein [Treponema sp.]